jgi:hypothetical protein
MAQIDDLKGGRGLDDALDELEESNPKALDTNNPVSILTGLVWLDEHYGLNQVDDFVLLHPDLRWIFGYAVKVDDPDLAFDITTPPVAAELLDRLSREVFTVTFGRYTEPQFAARRQYRVRLMTPDEQAIYGRAVTCRADGTVISLSANVPEIAAS